MDKTEGFDTPTGKWDDGEFDDTLLLDSGIGGAYRYQDRMRYNLGDGNSWYRPHYAHGE